jgi:hypothetical protein
MPMARLDATWRLIAFDGDTAGHSKLNNEKPTACEGNRHLLSAAVGTDDRVANTKCYSKVRIVPSFARIERHHALARKTHIEQLSPNEPWIE